MVFYTKIGFSIKVPQSVYHFAWTPAFINFKNRIFLLTKSKALEKSTIHRYSGFPRINCLWTNPIIIYYCKPSIRLVNRGPGYRHWDTHTISLVSVKQASRILANNSYETSSSCNPNHSTVYSPVLFIMVYSHSAVLDTAVQWLNWNTDQTLNSQ